MVTLLLFLANFSIPTLVHKVYVLEANKKWDAPDKTWQGDAKEQFTNGFERTKDAVDRSLEVGERAVDWLERFHEIAEDFERRR